MSTPASKKTATRAPVTKPASAPRTRAASAKAVVTKPASTRPAATKPRAAKPRTTKPAMAKPAAPEPEAAVLSAEDVAKAFALSRKSTSIELKLTIPATGHRATIKRLKLDPVEAQPRQAFFFDTPNLDLFKAGVVVRARRIQGGRGDTVIKLRPVEPDHVDPDLRRTAGFKIELDMMPGGFVCSASFKGACTNKEILDVSAGDTPLSELFSKAQRAFYEAHAPAGLSLDSLVTMGPVFLLKGKHLPKDFERGITVEMWLYPDGSRILEVSTKCLPEEAFQVIAEFKAYLARCGIALSGVQEPKTRNALEFFAAHPD
ncbi:hypothetical protein [Thiobacillus sp.]|uniref:hypothetical protein n=1 Tax=Thiobacillus sp. TaxID=924 RepID=UPI0025E1B198|nr:hypothetical protein [Thiobacillus sp.]MBT9541252.1 adenylate cyclase [Thiobacillus sp.]